MLKNVLDVRISAPCIFSRPWRRPILLRPSAGAVFSLRMSDLYLSFILIYLSFSLEIFQVCNLGSFFLLLNFVGTCRIVDVNIGLIGIEDMTPTSSQPSAGHRPSLLDSPIASTSSSVSTTSSAYGASPTVRRGPGRPRLKPGGPPNTGSRGTYRPRKPARPLPVPLPPDAAPSGTNSAGVSSSAYSTYLYDFPDQSDS